MHASACEKFMLLYVRSSRWQVDAEQLFLLSVHVKKSGAPGSRLFLDKVKGLCLEQLSSNRHNEGVCRGMVGCSLVAGVSLALLEAVQSHLVSLLILPRFCRPRDQRQGN